MRSTILLSLGAVLAAATAAAQAPAQPLTLTVDGAVRMALEQNVDLAADRLDPQIGDARVAAAVGAFRPTITSSLQRNNQLQPPATFLIPFATRNNTVSSNVGVSQRLRWFGASYSVAWSATHTDSNSALNTFNPTTQSGLSLGVSQPLLRDRLIDSSRLQVAISRTNRDIADTRLRERVVRLTADVKRAYWNLVSARASVDARQGALELAEELARVNQAKVDVGQSPPLDLLAARAEVVADQEALIVAETGVRLAEDRLRLLIFDPADRSIWSVPIVTADSPPLGTSAVDVEAAITTALSERADLTASRQEIANAQASLDFAGNQRLPDVRLNANYAASGLGGTRLLRTEGFPGTILGTGATTSFGSVLGQLAGHDYPTWSVGVSVSYPIGPTSDEANYARARLEREQADDRLKGLEGRAIQEVRSAGYNVEMNARRIETARAARDLAEQRLDAERKRFEVGMSTSFLVIQAQRDLAQAKTNELAAVLAYDLAQVDFEAVQQTGSGGR